MAVSILYRNEIKEYDFGIGHPFRGDRYDYFMKFMIDHLPEKYYEILTATPATVADLLRICDQDYIAFSTEYFRATHAGWTAYFDGFSQYQSEDNKPMLGSGNLEEAARLVVGQAKMACDLVESGQYQKVISIGGGLHHAKHRFGEGFCIYNDVAFSALYLIEKYGLDRVMVLDTDAHAGNGTAEYVRTNSKVLYVDIHQDPCTIYPGTGFTFDIGEAGGLGLTFNIPLPIFAGDASYEMVFDEIILPLTQEYKPQIVIRNGGSDPHFDDRLTNLGLTVAGFRMMGEKVRQMADICQGKQIDLIASGYNMEVLPYAWLSLLSGIADFPVTINEPSPRLRFQQDKILAETAEVVNEVKNYHQVYWKCFQ